MASVYKHLTEEDLRVENESLSNLEKKIEQFEKKPWGMIFAITLAFILSLAALAGAVYLGLQVRYERSQRQTLEELQVQLQQKAEAFARDSEQSLTRYRQEMERMCVQLRSYTGIRKEYDKKLETSSRQIEALRSKLTALEARDQAVVEEILGDESVENLQPPVGETPTVEPPAETAPATSASAVSGFQVLSVNRKFNFVVINLGLRDGVKLGDSLILERDGQETGQVAVEKVYEGFSAAAIRQESRGTSIGEGDTIRRP